MKVRSLLLFLWIAVISFSTFAQNVNSTLKYSWEQTLSFIENKGQFDGRTGLSEKIMFATDYNGLQVFFTKKGLTYRYDRFIRNPERTNENRQVSKRICLSELAHVSFVGANTNVELLASNKTQHYFSYAYYDSKTGDVLNENHIRGYASLTYKNLYNHTDVEYVCHPGKGIKYNLYLHPGADASQIQMAWEGLHTTNRDEHIDFSLSPEGHFRIAGSMLDITELKPVAYYEDNNEAVDIAFTLNSGTLGFDLGNYDKTRTLVIDPWIVSPVFTNSNAVWEVETDNAGHVYAIGGESPMKLNKYDNAGNLVWSYATPWDTAGYWLGTMATNNAGTTYITAGVSPRIQKIGSDGTMHWNNSGPNSSCEYWGIAFNCDTSQITVGGTYLPNQMGFVFHSAAYDINTLDGSITGMQLFDSVSVSGIGATPIEIRSIAPSRNARYSFLTHNAVGQMPQNTSNWPNNTPLYKMPLSTPYGYKCENFLPATQNGGGLKAIIASNNYVFVHMGNQIQKRDLDSGVLLDSANIPGGQAGITLGMRVVRNCGLDVDSCGNVYAGSMDRVVKFDENLNILAEEMTGFAVYDVRVNINGEVLAIGALSNNSAVNRNGKIGAFAMNACTKYEPSCCDANISPTTPVCIDADTFNLIASASGGIWSGTGITDTLAGTFDPALAGTGNHIVTYTMPCGSASALIRVDSCLKLCSDAYGNILVSGGTAPYTWQEWQPASSISLISNQSDCISCGYTWNSLVNQCLNGLMPVTSCVVPPHFEDFASGTFLPAPVQFPLRVYDVNGSTASADSLSSVPACIPCNSLSAIISNIQNSCTDSTSGSFEAQTIGGTAPYTLTLKQGSSIITTQDSVYFSHTFSGLMPGTYTLEISDSLCQTTTPVIISELLLPDTAGLITGTPTVTAGQTGVSYQTTPIGNTMSYTWVFPTGVDIVSGADSHYVVVNFLPNAQSGVAYVYGSNECGDGISSLFYSITVLTAIDEMPSYTFNMYPNPTHGTVTIEMNPIPAEIPLMKVYDILGQVILETELVNDTKQTFDLGHLANGVYFIEFSGKRFLKTQKLIIQTLR